MKTSYRIAVVSLAEQVELDEFENVVNERLSQDSPEAVLLIRSGSPEPDPRTDAILAIYSEGMAAFRAMLRPADLGAEGEVLPFAPRPVPDAPEES